MDDAAVLVEHVASVAKMSGAASLRVKCGDVEVEYVASPPEPVPLDWPEEQDEPEPDEPGGFLQAFAKAKRDAAAAAGFVGDE